MVNNFLTKEISINNLIKTNFTKEELLYLILRDYTKYRDEYQVPEILTLDGLSTELSCDPGFMSKILKKNLSEGLIFRKKVRIENKKRKQYAYFLTTTGLELAKKIHDILLKNESTWYLKNEVQIITDMIKSN